MKYIAKNSFIIKEMPFNRFLLLFDTGSPYGWLALTITIQGETEDKSLEIVVVENRPDNPKNNV